MAIEAVYTRRIEEIKQVASTLTKWEHGFIFGDGADNDPIMSRDSLSDKQKAILDRIYKERVVGLDREESAVIEFGNLNIIAVPAEGKKTYRIALNKRETGPVIDYNAAVAVTAWLTNAVSDGVVSIENQPETAKAEVQGDGKFPGE